MHTRRYAALFVLAAIAAGAANADQDLTPSQKAVAQIGMALALAAYCDKTIDQGSFDAVAADKLGDSKFSGKEMIAAASAAVAGYVLLSTKKPAPTGPFDTKAMTCAIAVGAFGPDGHVMKGLIKP